MNQKQYIQLGCTTAFISIILLFTAFYIPTHILQAVNHGIQNNLISLTPSQQNNTHYIQWQNSSTKDAPQQYLIVHFYDISNIGDIVTNNDIPIVTELQPLKLHIHKQRYNIQYSTDNYTAHEIVSYNEQLYYTVDTTYNTTTTLDTPITTVNFILFGIYSVLPSQLLDLYPDTQYSDINRLFVQRSIGDMLFGYTDEISGQLYPGILHNMSYSDAMKQPLTSIYTHNRQIHKWQGESYVTTYKSVIDHKPQHRVPVWHTPDANRIYGSDGEYFDKNDIHTNSIVTTYVNDLYRTTLLYNAGSGTIKHHNINLLRYIPHNTIFGNIDSVPSNIVYNNYMYNGVLNLTSAYQQLPIYISKPLYLDADTELQDSVQYNTIKEYTNDELETELCVEPNTGITMKANKRYQVNINAKPLQIDDSTVWFKQFDTTVGKYIPVVWLEQTGEISKNNAHVFTQKVLHNIALAHTGANVLFFIATALIIVTVAALLHAIQMNKYDSLEIDNIHNDYTERLLP